MSKITIVVTQEDIDNGKPGWPYSCPIALALQRQQEYSTFSVTAYKIYVYHRGYVTSKKLLCNNTPAMAKFIDMFDNNLPVEPMEFEVEINDT